MQRISKPENCPDPFPRLLERPVRCVYMADLALIRFKEIIKTGVRGDALYITERPYRLQYMMEGDEDWHQVTVPAGMLTDLASVPWFARWLVGRVGRHLEAAIIHDFLYVAHRWDGDQAVQRAKRGFADKLMYQAMRDAGVNMVAAFAIYLAVRLFGGVFSKPMPGGAFLDINDPEVASRLHGDG